MTEQPAASLKAVTKRFGSHTAVANLDLSIPPGGIYGFIGPNGSGKTTTIRMLLGMIEADEGSVQVLGKSPGPDTLADIGYLPEERGLYRKMRIDRQLEYFGKLKGLSGKHLRKLLAEWLERFELTGWELKKVEALSKGMSQKIQFIAAVIAQPKLLILDEPFSGLDPVNQEVLRDAILDMKRQGTTIIFSTHDMYAAERMCDRVFMIYRGKKVLDGTLEQIRDQFGTDSIHVALDGKELDPKGWHGIAHARNMGKYWELRCDCDPQEILLKTMQQGPVRQFSIIHPTLQDIFVRLARPSEEDMRRE